MKDSIMTPRRLYPFRDQKITPLQERTCARPFPLNESGRSRPSTLGKRKQCCNSIQQSNPPVKQRPFSGAESSDAFSMYMFDDVFLHVLSFVVSESGLVDGDTLRSATLVCKRWHHMTNARKLWTVSDDDVDETLRESLPTRPSPWIREKLTKFHRDTFTNLIGFINLGRRKSTSHDVCDRTFKVRERSTGKHYLLSYQSTGRNAEILCELANAHRVQGDSFLSSVDGSSGWFAPVGVDMCHGKIMLWYPNYDLTVNEWLVTLQSHENLKDERSVKDILPVPISTIKVWLRSSLELLAKAHHNGIALSNMSHPPSFRLHNTSDDMSSSKMTICCPSLESVARSKPSVPMEVELLRGTFADSQLDRAASDVFFLGLLFVRIMLGGDFSFSSPFQRRLGQCEVGFVPQCSPTEILNSSRSHHSAVVHLQTAVRDGLPFLDEVGVNFMVSLLTENPEERLSAAEALVHPFLAAGVLDTPKLPNPPATPICSRQAHVRHLMTLEASTTSLGVDRKHLQMDCWAKLYDWIVEIVEVFELHQRCSFRAMQYLDSFFSRTKGPVKQRKYQLIAGTCLRLASMLEEDELSKASLVKCADYTFDTNNVTEAESAILEKLNSWAMSNPSIFDFVLSYLHLLDKSVECQWMTLYVSELAMQSQIFLFFKPSLVAASVVVVSQIALHQQGTARNSSAGVNAIWPKSLQIATGYSWDTVGPCVLRLSTEMNHVRSTMPELRMILRKYRRSVRYNVSRIHIPLMTQATLARISV